MLSSAQKGIFLLLPAVFWAAAGLMAQETSENHVIDPKLYEGMEYRMIGPHRGGRVTAVTGIPGRPYTFFMGSTGGGVWRTADAGESWENVSDGQITVGSIGEVTVAPSDPNVVYVGSGSACPRGNISAGNGVYKSDDGGDTWTHIGLPEAGQIGKIIVDPRDADRLWVAALGNIFGPNPQRGVFFSDDGGATWRKQLFVSDSTGAVDLAVNPSNPRVLYAAFWRAERKPWTLVDGGGEGGIWKTTDGGKTWNKLGGGLPGGLLGRIGVTVSPANPDRVWALVQARKEVDGGVYRSDDAGRTWKRINGDHKLRQRGWYYTHIHAHPTDENTVFVENVSFWRSDDGGKTFDTRIRTPHGDNHDLWINPERPEIMVQGNDGGANVTLNGGETWSTQLNQPTAEFYRVEVDNQFPYRVYGAQQDNSTISVPSRSAGGINPKQYWYAVGGGESGHVQVHPQNPDLIYAGTYSGEITRVNRAKGYTQQVTEYPHYTEGTPMRNLKYRFQWNAPIVISDHNPEVVYHASQYVHKTTDGGRSWEIISPDLTANIDRYMGIPGGPIQHDATGVEVYGSIFALAESPFSADELWAGSDDGLVHLTRDGGESWQNITPDDMPAEGTVNTIELSSHQPGRAFMAVYRYRDHDPSPYIFRTNNYGEDWTLLTDGENGIPADHFVRVVREDPRRKGLLYAGTEFGMYLSFDDGAHWQPFQQNLPHTPVTDIAVHRNDLVLSTQGRSFWIMDDLTPLHRMDRELASQPFHLFPPDTALRTNLDGSWGENAPDARPAGAMTYFNLKDKPAEDDTVSITILEADGDRVRTYSTHPDSAAREQKLEVSEGLNRWTWDLRYPGPFQQPDVTTMVMGNPQEGPVAPTGSYRVRLKVKGQTQEQPFELELDPRWDMISGDDLRAQFELAVQIRDMISTSQRAIGTLRSVREQASTIAERARETRHEAADELTRRAEELDRLTTAIEDTLVNNRIESGQDAIGMERRFTNRIGRLYTLVIREHARPTEGIRERFEDLKTFYDRQMARYHTLLDNEVAAFNDVVERYGLPHVWE